MSPRQPPGAEPAARPPLDVVQRWFQAVVTHPAGVAAGVGSPAAQELVRLDRGALEELVRGSSRLTAEERLSIYANAFYARLLECLGDSFPVVKRVLGAEVFDGFAFDYLQSYPSRSYTLDRLAESFPRFLAETRPDAPPADGTAAAPGAADAPAPGFADFLIDLATLELAIAQVFDGPGSEGEPLLSAGGLPTADRFAAARLLPVPCLRLLRFSHPVNAFYTAMRALPAPEAAPAAASTLPATLDSPAAPTTPAAPTIPAAPTTQAAPSSPANGEDAGELPPLPAPGREHLALSRSDFVVRRYVLDALEYDLLTALLAGARVGDAIAAAAAASELADDPLARRIDAAFRRFTAAGFFRAATS